MATTTWYEKGMMEGQRRTLLKLVEKRFGPLNEARRSRLLSFSNEQLEKLEQVIFLAQSLADLDLGDDMT